MTFRPVKLKQCQKEPFRKRIGTSSSNVHCTKQFPCGHYDDDDYEEEADGKRRSPTASATLSILVVIGWGIILMIRLIMLSMRANVWDFTIEYRCCRRGPSIVSGKPLWLSSQSLLYYTTTLIAPTYYANPQAIANARKYLTATGPS